MKLENVLSVLRQVAPEHLAEDWDQVGLHLAGNGKPVRKAMLCIDLTPPVLAEAIAGKCQLIVAYHPPIFHPLKRLADRDWKETMLAEAIRKGIAVYSPHTALDAVRGGMNDWLCGGLGKGAAEPIHKQTLGRDEYKVVVFTPEDTVEAVRAAMSAAGAGGIGNYRECSFETPGVGGFRPMKGASPAVGKVGRRETVNETRLEMICGGPALAGVLTALRSAHPYEEPAVDVFRLEPEPANPATQHGAGRVLTLDQPITGKRLAAKAKKLFGQPRLKVAGPMDRELRRLAVCPGAGGSLFEQVASCDAYITGEMQHHQVLDMYNKGKVVILAGHTNTERPFLKNYREAIVENGGERVEWVISETDVAPIGIV